MNLYILLISTILILTLYFWYVSIITRRNAMLEAFSGVDVQLKKRTDLIPNILKIAAKFMEHEKFLLEEVTKLRTEVLKASKKQNDVSVEKRFELENLLENKLSGLMVSVENYPELKSQENMVEAQRVYADVEEHISAARRSYNAALTSLKNSIEIFPGNILASVLNIKPMSYFEIKEIERKTIDANKFLK